MTTNVSDQIAAGDPTAGYAPGEGRPLAAYALLSAAFFGGLAAALAAARAGGREIERPGLPDVLLHGLATQKLSRLIAKDKVTSFLRAPFTRFQERAGRRRGCPGRVRARRGVCQRRRAARRDGRPADR